MMNSRIRCRKGMTLIEVLMGMMIVAVSIATMVSLWSFSFGLTGKNSARGAAYNVGRKSMERFKQAGFSGIQSLMGSNQSLAACLYDPATNSYVSTLYYDASGSTQSTTQVTSGVNRSAYSVTGTVSVNASEMTTDTPAAVADDALIKIDVTVTQLNPGPTGAISYRTGTYLVRSGI